MIDFGSSSLVQNYFSSRHTVTGISNVLTSSGDRSGSKVQAPLDNLEVVNVPVR